MIEAGVVGGAGYTAGELVRILTYHPEVEITSIQSSSQAGAPVASVHKDLAGETSLSFTDRVRKDVDVIFLCSGHGRSKAFVEEQIFPDQTKIIDLSHDFRIANVSHKFIYGLPELNRNKIQQSTRIANPGCFATCIELAVLPLAAQGLLKDNVHVTAVTGSTGAGQQPTQFTHFSWRNNNLSVYKAFEHQHLAEINQSILSLQSDFNHELYFVPMRGDFARGILATTYTKFEGDLDKANALYRDYYKDSPFVHVTEQNPDLKQVVNTNKCLLHLKKHGEILLVISMIDNLVKGASGQAVQNLNLSFGLEEKTGLQLKASVF